MDLILINRNIRLRDNAALFYGSLNQNYRVIYPYDREYWNSNGRSEVQFNFFLESLQELDNDLRKLNSCVEIFDGGFTDLRKYIDENCQDSKIHVNHITETNYFRNKFIDFKRHFEKTQKILTYSDFGIQTESVNRDKWAYDWNKLMKKNLLDAPKPNIINTGKGLVSVSQFKEINSFSKQKSHQTGGSSQAYQLLNTFLMERSKGYSQNMSSPIMAESSCSRLSPHISFGTISIREIYQKLESFYPFSPNKRDLSSFRKRLYWHCHFIQKLETEPELEFSSMHRMCDNLREKENSELIEKWISGETGFPFMDACMKYLKENGWINFRMRAMMMSFASYNLWQPWQVTSPLLAELFVDYEPGIHIPQVQMQSGVTGINLPRIYSVTKQSRDQDPEAIWIKKVIPSLNDYDIEDIHNAELKEKYLPPVVDLKESSKYARERIWGARKGNEFKTIARSVYLKHGSRKRRNA